MDPNGHRQTEEDGGVDDTCLGGYALVRRDGKLVKTKVQIVTGERG